MKELSLREVQLGELEILKRLDSICREQGLKYFLYAGTMIGAVRHKAFIPWDDDIDVAMPRRDYDRLMAWWDEHGAQEAPLRMMNIHTSPACATRAIRWITRERGNTVWAFLWTFIRSTAAAARRRRRSRSCSPPHGTRR